MHSGKTHTFYVKNLCRKVRKGLSCCDVCQRVKHPNSSHETESRSHLPKKPGDTCALDLYGQLPVGRGGVRYILVCLDVFSKHITLYSFRAATTKACLNKLTTDYFPHMIKPRCILSDHCAQFTSPVWKKNLSELHVTVRYLPISHPDSNLVKHVMREREWKILQNLLPHDAKTKKWPELIHKIEFWLNTTIPGSTGFTSVELMFNPYSANVENMVSQQKADGI
jgi:hypothetical protein